jgi:hypothetical protein
MTSSAPSEETLRKQLDIQWQDHFQTRTQTWKALEITALLAVALVGLDWRAGNQFVTIGTAVLLLIVAQFGVLITRHHRDVEITKLRIITALEKQLGIADEKLKPPAPIRWFTIFQVWKSNTPLFILRMYFIIQVFAIGYCALRVLSP